MKNTDTSGRYASIDGNLFIHLVLVLLFLNVATTLTGAPGDTRWVFETGGAVNSSPAIGTDGTVFGNAQNTRRALPLKVSPGAVNTPPSLAVSGPQVLDELTRLTLTNRASDADVPANRLTFGLLSGPEGVQLDPATGLLTWTPTEAQGPSTNVIVLTVADNGIPSLSDTGRFAVVVNEVNTAPRLTTAIRSLTVYGGQKLVFTHTATDADWPTNALAFLLDADAPTGAQLDRITGVFRWTAPAVAAPQTDRFTVWVTDNGEPWKSDSGIFTVVTSPAPADLRLLGIQWVAAGVVRITWETSPGARYQLQSTARLDAPAWVSAGDIITATADTASQANACGTNAQSYFRVRRVED